MIWTYARTCFKWHQSKDFYTSVPEFLDPVFATSPKRSISKSENERFGMFSQKMGLKLRALDVATKGKIKSAGMEFASEYIKCFRKNNTAEDEKRRIFRWIASFSRYWKSGILFRLVFNGILFFFREIRKKKFSYFTKTLTTLHCKKELAVFPSPAGMSLIKLFLDGNNLVFSRPERVWSVTSRLGTGKWLTPFYSV